LSQTLLRKDEVLRLALDVIGVVAVQLKMSRRLCMA
jgi:hypothetical protein